jgi:hypothetical protein
METLENKLYDWIKDYLPPDNADELSKLLAYEARQYCKHQFVAGLLSGVAVTILILKWLS